MNLRMAAYENLVLNLGAFYVTRTKFKRERVSDLFRVLRWCCTVSKCDIFSRWDIDEHDVQTC